MHRKVNILLLILCLALLLGGCGLKTVDELYCLPERSDADNDLQKVIDEAMEELEYAPPKGDNRQVTQKVDLDGDGTDECLVFAKEKSTRDLKILVFGQLASGYVLMDTIEGNCLAFDSVSFAQIDGEPGFELIVGRQLSNDLTRYLSVYRFSSEHVSELLHASYERLLLCNFDGDEISELLLISESKTEEGSASVALYGLKDGEVRPKVQRELSQGMEKIKRAVHGKLAGGVSGIFVTGVTADDQFVTDVLVMNDGEFRIVHTSQPMTALGPHSLYPEDMDADGILEIPELVSMPLHPEQAQKQYFVRWYSVDAESSRTEDLFTYINVTNGWFMTLESRWAEDVSVVHSEEESVFYLWDAGHKIARKLMTIYTMTEAQWQQLPNSKTYTVLYESETVVYAAKLGDAAADYGLKPEKLIENFRMMRTDRMTDEN